MEQNVRAGSLEPAPSPQIPKTVEVLKGVAIDIEERIAVLRDRLAPVSNASPEKANTLGREVKVESSCPLLRELRAIRDMLTDSLIELDFIKDQLEI